jgi:hypothetical protein
VHDWPEESGTAVAQLCPTSHNQVIQADRESFTVKYSAIVSTLVFICIAIPAWGDDLSAEGPARSPSATDASVSFKNLKDGDVLPLTFVAEFRVSGMGVVPAGSNIDNTGHHHLLIDLDELPDMERPLPASANIRHFGKAQNDATLELSVGEHTLQLLFADYLHIPHDPPVLSDKITITVSPDAPPQSNGEEDKE